jgi:hypothetical protein
MSLLNSADENFDSEKQSSGRLLLGALLAVLVAGLLIAGYSLLRKRHEQKVIAAQQLNAPPATEPKGPPKVQILVDEALMKGDQRLLGGTVKNISNANLSDLVVELELTRRKDGGTEKISAAVDPKELTPQQEGRYAFQLKAVDYLSVRLAGLRSLSNPDQLAFLTGIGQKRPPEKYEGKTIIVSKPSSAKGGFLNTPDNPGRVP